MLYYHRSRNLWVSTETVEGLLWKSYSLAAASFFSKYLQLEGSYSKSHCWPQSGIEEDRIYQLLIWEINTCLCFEQEIDRFTNSAICYLLCSPPSGLTSSTGNGIVCTLYSETELCFSGCAHLCFFPQLLKTPNQVVFAVSPFVLYSCLIFLPWGTAGWFWRYT